MIEPGRFSVRRYTVDLWSVVRCEVKRGECCNVEQECEADEAQRARSRR
jgi:hypothetical protein